MPKRDLLAIESKWREHVLAPVYEKAREGKGKQYVLAQFPYPSGSLHMGHARVYAMSDCLARKYRLEGYNVMNPMGWDAFGLPAENAARERQIDPAIWTNNNIKLMRKQMNSLGFAFDWQLEINTSQKTYYKWSQYLFKRLYNKGLAYRAEAPVNWDPVDQTVLADEQVDSSGRSWRSGAHVEKKVLSQWFLKITAYADRLIDDLDQLTGWPESVKQMQRDWIGRQIGYDCAFYHGDSVVHLYLTQPIENVDKIIVPKDHSLSSLRSLSCELNSDHIIPLEVADDENSEIRVEYKKCIVPYNLRDSGYKLYKKYRLRDWLISRQRSWGTPIPISYCAEHGHMLDDNSLCPICLNKNLVREQDTMDTFVDSSWYYLRFCDPTNENLIFDHNNVKDWMPVDVYIGGIEHAVLHLLYARFIHKFIVDDQCLDSVPSEPFSKLICQGIVMGRTFKCPDTGAYLRNGEYTLEASSGTFVPILPDGRPATISYEKMSKSKYNGVDPTELVEKYGADAVRLYILFKAPPEYPLYWDERDLIGQYRWLVRLVQMYEKWTECKYQPDKLLSTSDEELLVILNNTIEQCTKDISSERAQFHTAIASLMKLSNHLASFKEQNRSATFKSALESIAIMLHSMAPFCSSELYEMCTGGKSVLNASWPVRMELPAGTVKSTTLAVQVNGRTMHKIRCPAGSDQDYIHQRVSDLDSNLCSNPAKIIFVPDRVINYCK